MSPWMFGSIGLTLAGWVGWLALYLRSDIFPEKAPIHWNLNMEVDGWASRENAVLSILFAPGIMTLMLGLSWLLPQFSEGLREPRTRARFDLTMFSVQTFLFFMGGIIVYAIHSGVFPASLMMAAMFVLFGLLGFAMKGIQPNPYFGVRTPWTLNDPVVWERTHALTARVWLAIAAIGLVALAVGMPPIWSLAMILPLAVIPIVASYVFSRRTHS